MNTLWSLKDLLLLASNTEHS